MTRKSRAKSGRIQQLSNAQRRAKRNDDRGRRVGTKVKDYERICVAGPGRLAETLLARHNMRMLNTTRMPVGLRMEAVEFLAPVVMLDAAHRKLNLTLNRAPSAYYGTWPRDLGWGVDSSVAATRLLLAGQIVAAATIARQQLERWTVVMAPVVGIEKGPDEGVEAFIARAWTAYAELDHGSVPRADVIPAGGPKTDDDIRSTDDDDQAGFAEPDDLHRHVYLSDGKELCPAVIYAVLSELMHARLFEDALWWESTDLLRRFTTPDDAYGAVRAVADALSLCLIQIRYMTAAALSRQGDKEAAWPLVDRRIWFDRYTPRNADIDAVLTPESSSYPVDFVLPELAAIMPLAPMEGLQEGPLGYLHKERLKYESLQWGARPEGRLYRDDELATLAFTAHRDASARFAQYTMEAERDYFGENFRSDSLTGRGTDYVLIAEMAAIASLWTHESDELTKASPSLALVSSSLRSAYWLWLEDDDRAMASLRCTLEQIARVRVIRVKPNKAVTLDNSNHNKPQRWIEAAGWNRLSALNRALGEYAHAHRKPNWSGARELLKELQVDADADNALQTARGNALSLVATLVARETIGILEVFSRKVADTAGGLLTEYSGVDMTEAALEAMMNKSHTHRTTPMSPT